MTPSGIDSATFRLVAQCSIVQQNKNTKKIQCWATCVVANNVGIEFVAMETQKYLLFGVAFLRIVELHVSL
jgi:hypothetical protein